MMPQIVLDTLLEELLTLLPPMMPYIVKEAVLDYILNVCSTYDATNCLRRATRLHETTMRRNSRLPYEIVVHI